VNNGENLRVYFCVYRVSKIQCFVQDLSARVIRQFTSISSNLDWIGILTLN